MTKDIGRVTGSRPSGQALLHGLGGSRFDPARISIYGEAVPAYGRTCRTCGGVAALDQLNRYFHYGWDEASGEHVIWHVIWLPGRYCSRECMEKSPFVDWRRHAIATRAVMKVLMFLGIAVGAALTLAGLSFNQNLTDNPLLPLLKYARIAGPVLILICVAGLFL